MTDRYEPMTFAESAELARSAEDAELLDRMGTCDHVDACLRAVGVLCVGDEGYGNGFGAKAQAERLRAARWMKCMDCECWEGCE